MGLKLNKIKREKNPIRWNNVNKQIQVRRVTLVVADQMTKDMSQMIVVMNRDL